MMKDKFKSKSEYAKGGEVTEEDKAKRRLRQDQKDAHTLIKSRIRKIKNEELRKTFNDKLDDAEKLKDKYKTDKYVQLDTEVKKQIDAEQNQQGEQMEQTQEQTRQGEHKKVSIIQAPPAVVAGAKLNVDDGKKDTGLYQNLVDQVKKKGIDFSRLYDHIRTNNKEEINKYTSGELIEKTKELCQKYKVNLIISDLKNISGLRRQYTELRAIDAAFQMRIKDNKDENKKQDQEENNIAFLIDVDEFKEGGEIDYDKFFKKYKKEDGTIDEKRLYEDYKGANLDIMKGDEKLVNKGFTSKKPEYSSAMNDFKSLIPSEEGAIIQNQTYTRQDFNLAKALITAEQDLRHRNAQKVDTVDKLFKYDISFNYRQPSKKGRNNLA